MLLDPMDGGEVSRVIGAVVIRSLKTGEVLIDLGPADGPPLVRLRLDRSQAIDFATGVNNVAETGGEKVLLMDDRS
ncbi:hypothetical protein BH23CHL5_BH23CHL5_11110 [soil metagenome]